MIKPADCLNGARGMLNNLIINDFNCDKRILVFSPNGGDYQRKIFSLVIENLSWNGEVNCLDIGIWTGFDFAEEREQVRGTMDGELKHVREETPAEAR